MTAAASRSATATGASRKGEAVDLLLTVKNVGAVPAQHTSVEISLPPNPSVKLNKTLLEFGTLKPDETKHATANLFIGRDIRDEHLASSPLHQGAWDEHHAR